MMSKISKLFAGLFLVAALCFFAGCTKDNPQPEPAEFSKIELAKLDDGGVDPRIKVIIDRIKLRTAQKPVTAGRASCNKISIMHNGNPINIAYQAVPGHLAHGDLGCEYSFPPFDILFSSGQPLAEFSSSTICPNNGFDLGDGCILPDYDYIEIWNWGGDINDPEYDFSEYVGMGLADYSNWPECVGGGGNVLYVLHDLTFYYRPNLSQEDYQCVRAWMESLVELNDNCWEGSCWF